MLIIGVEELVVILDEIVYGVSTDKGYEEELLKEIEREMIIRGRKGLKEVRECILSLWELFFFFWLEYEVVGSFGCKFFFYFLD